MMTIKEARLILKRAYAGYIKVPECQLRDARIRLGIIQEEEL